MSLDCFRADVFSALKRLFLSHSCINVASSIFTIGVDSNKNIKIYKIITSITEGKNTFSKVWLYLWKLRKCLYPNSTWENPNIYHANLYRPSRMDGMITLSNRVQPRKLTNHRTKCFWTTFRLFDCLEIILHFMQKRYYCPHSRFHIIFLMLSMHSKKAEKGWRRKLEWAKLKK